MPIVHFYLKPVSYMIENKLKILMNRYNCIESLDFEFCFNVQVERDLTPPEQKKLKWLISESASENDTEVRETGLFSEPVENGYSFEIGPRLNFSTPYSTNAVSVCHAAGLSQVTRVEISIIYFLSFKLCATDLMVLKEVREILRDPKTGCLYNSINSFDHGIKPEPWYIVDVKSKGKKALDEINSNMGLALDEWDINFYYELFVEKLKRNPTNVECFDLAQSNSEHCRHWFFKGILNINKLNIPTSLFQLIMETQISSNQNNVIKFNDNSSAIEGFTVRRIKPNTTTEASKFVVEQSTQHLVFTAETHNFPTAVSPFHGAATGTGGRIRDIQAVGRGGHTIAGTVGYAVGNLLIPNYDLPWEDFHLQYPTTFAKPLAILIEGSNGCSDYGNKFGEPVICGFTRSSCTVLEDERIEYIKPILFSGGIGSLDGRFVAKEKPMKGMKVAKIGGPVYRIGVGGGSASSTKVQGDNKSKLDYDAVQRGDPEMEQKLNRVVRNCVEFARNPILSIHDQGAGGNGNVLKELVEPEGAVIFTKAFEPGDSSINVLELWGAEYQESNGILCRDEDITDLERIAKRERCTFSVVGTVTGTGKVILTEEDINHETFLEDMKSSEDTTYPVNLDLELVLGNVPKKVFKLTRKAVLLKPLHLPSRLTVYVAMNRVFRHLTVCSKRFLTNKVDRSVTGLVAQQQCVGPLQTPVADVAVTAISYFDERGIATSIGEQPVKMLLNPSAGARMSVAEAMSNLVFAKISSIRDIKCSANWMWPAKLPGEGAKLYDACEAMCTMMKTLKIAIDGGKDSLSMATRLNENEIVKSPGTLVISAYAPCPDINEIITPDLKSVSYGIKGSILLVDLSGGKKRMGGSVLAQCFGQLGHQVPDIENAERLSSAFLITQELISEKRILAGHDISDGGLITTLIEMAIAGMSGIQISLPRTNYSAVSVLFAEECGWVLECEVDQMETIIDRFWQKNVNCFQIGVVENFGMDAKVVIRYKDKEVVNEPLHSICSLWEQTGFQIEKLQMNPKYAEEEFHSYRNRKYPEYEYKFDFNPIIELFSKSTQVALIREEGINGDREMAAALYMAGFEVWDCTMQDLLDEKITIDRFQGVIFPGGFSYGDVFGAAKGWAASLLYNMRLYRQFTAFYNRKHTFSFGVCNGCQLMSLIKWIGSTDELKYKDSQILLKDNLSSRFESRFSSVKICKSPSIMLQGMEDSVLGVWVAHGEGRFIFSSQEFEYYLKEKNCFALKYVDDTNQVTEQYPFNPNGSSDGIAGICSLDGRHLAMMPHPERCVKFWQWPYIPAKWKDAVKASQDNFSPWFQIFLNAYKWCSNNQP